MYTCFLLTQFHQMLWSPNSKRTIFYPEYFLFLYYHIWQTKHHCQRNKSAFAMLTCLVCSFEALSKKIWRCTCKTSMMDLKSSHVNRTVVTQFTFIWLFILKELKIVHAQPQILHVNFFYDWSARLGKIGSFCGFGHYAFMASNTAGNRVSLNSYKF